MSAASEIVGDVSQRFGKSVGYTYTGKFDADNVFCTALFLCMNPDFVYRRRDTLPSPDAILEESIIFYDFRTDEESYLIFSRNANKEYRPSGIRYGTFGLVWREFGRLILLPWGETEEAINLVKYMLDDFDEEIIAPMDAARLNGSSYPIQDIINSFNLIENESNVYYGNDTIQYDKAVSVARGYLLRTLEIYKMNINSMLLIYNTYLSQAEDTPGILYLDNSFAINTPWALEFIREHMTEVNYIIRPSTLTGYNIYPVKKTLDDLKVEFPQYYDNEERISYAIYKTPLPVEWYTMIPEDLNAGWKGLFYCQPDGSRATTFTKDDAILICKNLIRAYTNSNASAESITTNDGLNG